MEEYILNCYLEYKKFMKQSNLPDIRPVFNIQDANINRTIAYIERDDLREPIIPIYISKKLFSYSEQYYKSILFHEFTHVFDANITFININNHEKLTSLMSSYSEYHASQIELLSSLGYKVIRPIFNKFNINTRIYSENELLDIENYLLIPLSSAIVILEKQPDAYINLSRDEYNKKYITAMKNIYYYLGKYKICELYGNRKPHNFFHEFLTFQDDVKTIYQSLQEKNYDQIIKDEHNFMRHYLHYFKEKTRDYI